MTSYPYAGYDASWPQGSGFVGSGSFAIIACASGDGLSVGQTSGFFTQSTYRSQVAAARAAGKQIGHYFYNGGDPIAAARYFVQALYTFGPHDTLWTDVEGRNAWSDAQTAAFNAEVRRLTGCLPGVYTYRSLMSAKPFSQCIAAGSLLWLATPGNSNPALTGWHEAAMMQTGSPGGVDADVSAYTQAQIRVMQGGSPLVEDDDVSYSIIPDGTPGSPTVFVESQRTGDYVKIGSTYHQQLLTRAKKNDGTDKMLPAELDIVKAYVVAIDPPQTVTVDAPTINTSITEADKNDIAGKSATATVALQGEKLSA